MTTILQLSDTHIAPKDRLVSGRVDTQAALERLVARIKGLLPQVGPVDAMLVSGDISDKGSAESYEHFRELIAPLKLPVYVIPGNHDLRDPMRQAFAADGYLPPFGNLNWHRKVGSVHLIGLDTLVEGQGGGALDAVAFEFLKTALDAAGDEPVLLALHHQPYVSGIAFMDKIGLDGAAELASLLDSYQNEIRVVCGHIHSTMVSSIGSKVVISSPSPCTSFAFDLRQGAPVGFFAQEDGFLLHRWHDSFLSVRIAAEPGAGPYAFQPK